ncbi:hypothetical protein EYM_02090 [Ignicoccus islandicus DSM 13165]|uniref:DUF61 domain-containing protein n=1 Tax=Ignicoccus islandicus DSM 13165 TaxID=940295 RepID=A0A0U3E2Z1_9CREN|nr:DUF61 family protein [Ignicoccus islandicus]ALU12283.1 hypothetical protein EYM_02090 [Ignicoccus islandicus DSM 13165]
MNDRELIKLTISDFATINQSVPKEQIPLLRALRGEREVPLKDGTVHLMDEDDLQRLSNAIPSWLRWLVKVPIVLSYNPETGALSVMGDQWQEEAVRNVLGLERDEKLKFYHLDKLVMELGSLVFVIFAVDLREVISSKGVENE